jgi:nitrite reductase/ring-hydroxylating ferredoxin subunit
MKFFRRPHREPLWREEFSIFAADEQYVSRRQLTKFLVLTSLGLFAGNLWILARARLRKRTRPHEMKIANAVELPIGVAVPFRYHREPCILVRPDEQTFVAYSQKCTHLSCAVIYSHADQTLECPCHDGSFSVADGRVLKGPPPRPLTRVVLARRGDELVATGLEPDA